MTRTHLFALLLAVAGASQAQTTPILSPAKTMEEAGMVDIRSLVADMSQEIRYFGSDNFVGAPVTGYEAPRCWLKQEAAAALARVELAVRAHGQRLRVFDCYRPARAVAHFMRWAADAEDIGTKATHYPGLDKPQLLGGYIAPVSGHSRGATLDLTLLQCDATGAGCVPLDMGTAFDFFGTAAHTDSPEVSAAQRTNRDLLRQAMRKEGFVNYPMEWWHYTYQPEPAPGALYDVPITYPEAPMPEVAIDRLMQRYQGHAPGASLLVLKAGKPVLRRAYGRAVLETGVEAGPATNYRLASVSKQFTAAAVLLLAQDGRLRLETSVRHWLPELPEMASTITLQHLLTHTSGLADYEDLMTEPWPGQILDAGVLALLAKAPDLYFPPGTAYRYSNSGYALLALVVERASGLSYPDFLRTRIFQPLGMQATLAHVQGGIDVPHRAYGYSASGPGWERTDQSSTSAVLGDGGIYSNIDDLARWDAALDDDRLLEAKWRTLAFTPHVEVTGEGYEAGYGFGWRISGERHWHSGETIGFRNVFVRWPSLGLTVVLLTNRNDPPPYDIALQIGALFGAPMPVGGK